MKIYHYTTSLALNNILHDGKIRCAVAFVGINERPAVWFSTNPDWEKTVRKGIVNHDFWATSVSPRDGHLEQGIIPVRIEVDPALPFLTWKSFKKKSGIHKAIAQGLETTAERWGANPQEWLALFYPVGADHFLNIETWDGHNWQIYWKRED